MSQAHKGSRLITEGSLKSIGSNTVFLAHYDITENDVLRGIAPIQNISTLRTPEGKFGGGIAVEEATANILASDKQLFSGWNQYSGCVVTVTQDQIVPEWATVSATRVQTSGGGSTLKYYIGLETSISGGAYSAQCLIKNTGASSVKFRTQLGNSVTVAQGETTRAVCIGTGNGTTSFQLRFEALTIAENLDFIVYQPQAERKSFPTSWTSGSRADGILKYSADYINPLQGAISFWYKPSYATTDVTSQQTSPKVIQIGGYYANSSFSLWNFNNVLNIHVKGSSDTGWSLSASTGATFTKDVWTMLAITWNGTSWKVYKDGVQIYTGTASQSLGTINGNSLYVGGDGNGTDSKGQVANGIIDELRIDNIAITDEEIMSWYLSGAPFAPRGIYTIAY